MESPKIGILPCDPDNDEVDEEADNEQKVIKVLAKIQQPTFIIKTIMKMTDQ